MDSIFSITTPGFMFFLLIVCIGYVALGDLSVKTRIGSLERLIRYILAWVWINLVFLFIFSKSEWLLNFINTFFSILNFAATFEFSNCKLSNLAEAKG